MRGTSNENERGSTRDRAARRAWIMKNWASDYVDCVRCYRCGTLLYRRELTIDRIIPSAHGGTYRRNNIRPACSLCNSSTGSSVRSR